MAEEKGNGPIPVEWFPGPYEYNAINYMNYGGYLAVPMKYDPTKVKYNAGIMTRYDINRLRRQFKVEGLPDTIPERVFLLYILTHGHNFLMEVGGDLYIFHGGLGGDPSVYYEPQDYIIANPFLKGANGTYKIGKDGALIRSDSMMTGAMPILSKYNYQICTNELTMHVVDINARSSLVMSAEDDKDLESAKKYISDLEKGKLGVVTKMGMINGGVEVQPGATDSAQVFTHLIEMNQYLKASKENFFGFDTNWNAKREYTSEAEISRNSSSTMTYVDDMLNTINEGLEEANKMFGTNIVLSYDNTIDDNDKEDELDMEILENEAKGMEETQEGEQPEEEEKKDGGEEDADKSKKKEESD